ARAREDVETGKAFRSAVRFFLLASPFLSRALRYSPRALRSPAALTIIRAFSPGACVSLAVASSRLPESPVEDLDVRAPPDPSRVACPLHRSWLGSHPPRARGPGARDLHRVRRRRVRLDQRPLHLSRRRP